MTSVEDKENTSTIETITIDDTDTEKKENINTFFSPPKKKFKQDAVPFTKLPKNEETPKKKDENDLQRNVSNAAHTIDEKCPVNIKTPKNIKSVKNVSPKISTSLKNIQSPKSVPSEKNIKTSKNSPGVNKTKDVKSDGILFPKLSKEDALKESEKEVQIMLAKIKEQEKDESTGNNGEDKSISEIDIVDEITGNCETPTCKKLPSSTKKSISPISKEERQKAKEEKEMLKVARMKEMEEKRKKKEEERILKLAEKEKRENERKEKEKLREEEKRKREELLKIEKDKRDAEKEKKDAEREKEKVKEEQRRQEEEKKKQALKKKKEKEANHFRSFFTKKCTADTKAPTVELYQRFKPFQVKPDMVLAPLVRNNNINRELLDNILEGEIQNVNTYLQEQMINFVKNEKTKYISRRQKRRDFEEFRKLEVKNKVECQRREKPVYDESMDIQNVVVIDDNSNDMDDDEDNENETSVCDEKYLYISKLLQFSENTRPSYYGTWRKKSLHISGRKPFAKDTDAFNYDIDSDEEWIDEPGENLSDAPDDEEEEEKETEDDQDGFFVPHGYLSDDEGIKDEENEDEENNSEEVSKCTSVDKNEDGKLKLKVCSFERSFQRKLKHQKPICIGITYVNSIENTNPVLKDYMKVALFKPVHKKGKEEEEDIELSSPQSVKNTQHTPMAVPEYAMPILIRYVHGNVSSLASMVLEFLEYWGTYVKEQEVASHISKRQLEKRIQSIASRVSNKEVGKMCYVVKDEVVVKYGMTEDLKYGEGLPDIKSITKTQHECSEVKHITNNSETIQNEDDTCMEIN